MTWILLNFSSDDQDSRVTEMLLSSEYNLLAELNKDLSSEHCDPQVLGHILWMFANLLGESK